MVPSGNRNKVCGYGLHWLVLGTIGVIFQRVAWSRDRSRTGLTNIVWNDMLHWAVFSRVCTLLSHYMRKAKLLLVSSHLEVLALASPYKLV